MALPKISGNLQKRIISAGLLAPVILFIIYLGGIFFSALVIFAAVIMSFEWHGIVSSNKKDDIKPAERKKWLNYGILYVGIFASSLLLLRGLDNGFGLLLVLAMVWATDIAAYFSGRIFKGPKIYAKISPNKTWAGLIGGMIASGFVGAFASVFVHSFGLLTMVLLGAFLAAVAQGGDFFESYLKRKFGVKDSGTIIPGHGGVLDRVDGLTTAVPLFTIISLFNSGSFF